MTQVELFCQIMLTCFGGGIVIGRVMEQKRVTKALHSDWNRLFFTLYISLIIFNVEQAAKIGWIAQSVLTESFVRVGYWATLVLMLYFVVRCYRQSRTSAI